jgi:Glycosyl transferase family 2
VNSWQRYANRVLAAEISLITRYYDAVVQYARRDNDRGLLLDFVECPVKNTIAEDEPLPDFRGERERRSAILLNGTFNHSTDIQGLLTTLRAAMTSTGRVIAVVYNPYFGAIYKLANRLRLRSGDVPTTFVTYTDLDNIARLSGFRVVRMRSTVYSPLRLLGLGTFINAVLPAIPLLRHLSLAVVVVLAPEAAPDPTPTISVIVPTRNERGNIRPALDGLRAVRDELPGLEVVFVEGHSTDGTWDEIQRLIPEYSPSFRILALQQTGKGKGDAVRLGFRSASGDALMILDADLTVPPPMLGRFYRAYRDGLGDFINGSRLVYGAESGAMRLLNSFGNVGFAKLLSRVLSVRISDSLCGTKLVARHDYERFTAWRRDFGDFDPFGDFELLFPAAVLGLRIVDLPVWYRARTYGETNISRFRHGWMLLKMTSIGFLKVRLGALPR